MFNSNNDTYVTNIGKIIDDYDVSVDIGSLGYNKYGYITKTHDIVSNVCSIAGENLLVTSIIGVTSIDSSDVFCSKTIDTPDNSAIDVVFTIIDSNLSHTISTVSLMNLVDDYCLNSTSVDFNYIYMLLFWSGNAFTMSRNSNFNFCDGNSYLPSKSNGFTSIQFYSDSDFVVSFSNIFSNVSYIFDLNIHENTISINHITKTTAKSAYTQNGIDESTIISKDKSKIILKNIIDDDSCVILYDTRIKEAVDIVANTIDSAEFYDTIKNIFFHNVYYGRALTNVNQISFVDDNIVMSNIFCLNPDNSLYVLNVVLDYRLNIIDTYINKAFGTFYESKDSEILNLLFVETIASKVNYGGTIDIVAKTTDKIDEITFIEIDSNTGSIKKNFVKFNFTEIIIEKMRTFIDIVKDIDKQLANSIIDDIISSNSISKLEDYGGKISYTQNMFNSDSAQCKSINYDTNTASFDVVIYMHEKASGLYCYYSFSIIIDTVNMNIVSIYLNFINTANTKYYSESGDIDCCLTYNNYINKNNISDSSRGVISCMFNAYGIAYITDSSSTTIKSTISGFSYSTNNQIPSMSGGYNDLIVTPDMIIEYNNDRLLHVESDIRNSMYNRKNDKISDYKKRHNISENIV